MENMEIMLVTAVNIVIVIGLFLLVYVGTPLIAVKKGRSGVLWFVFAMILPVVAFIAVLFVGKQKRCPMCNERIDIEAKRCKHCHSELE